MNLYCLFIYLFSMNGLRSVKEIWLLTVKCVRCSVLTRSQHCGIASLFREMQHYYFISPTKGPKGVKKEKKPYYKTYVSIHTGTYISFQYKDIYDLRKYEAFTLTQSYKTLS